MDARSQREQAPTKHVTSVERTSDREVVVTRSFDAPAQLVFDAWSKPELFQRWWAPKSMGMTLLSCEMDVRVGGRYRLAFGGGMDFFGKYIEVTPHSRLVWTNEEGSRFAPAMMGSGVVSGRFTLEEILDKGLSIKAK